MKASGSRFARNANLSSEHRWTAIGAAVMVVVAATIATVGIAVGDRSPGRIQAVAFAAAICLVGSVGGWLAGRTSPADPARAVAACLTAVALRFFPAVTALVWLRTKGEKLRENGAAEWLLIFYLTLLAIDILLHILGGPGDRRRRGTLEN